MKELKYILLTLVCTLFASCMGDSYADPEGDNPYGNMKIDSVNIVTIEQLKQKYAAVIANSSMKEITDDIQILARVTGNDVGGNIYNEIAVQDETGAILVCINQSGLYGYLPVGQQVLISLKGLIIGGYGQQPEVGGIYTNAKTGAQSVGRMSRYTWDTHYQLFGSPSAASVQPEEFDLSKISDASYIAANCGKLMTLKGVKLKDADGKKVFAPSDGSVTLTANAANRAFDGISANNMVLRTSTYAKFANEVMPTDEINVTGIFTRYRNTWQILIRSLDDIETAEKFDINSLPGTGLGTAESPMNVERALSLVESGNHDPSAEVYVTGIISEIQEVSTQYGNATYFISDDGTDARQLEIYRGYAINGEKFDDTTKDLIQLGKKVVIAGKLTLYNNIIEFTTGSKIISIQ